MGDNVPRVELPRRRNYAKGRLSSADNPGMIDASNTPTRSLSILIVDDDPGLEEMLGNLLCFAGHRTKTAGTANEAMRRFAEGTFDLLLLDLFMPGMNGIEFLSRLRRRGRKDHVIRITGNPGACLVAHASSLGVSGGLRKPFTFQQLLEEVERGARILEDDEVCEPGPGEALWATGRTPDDDRHNG